MKDIQTLYQVAHPKTTKQLAIFLFCCSAGAVYWCTVNDAPFLFTLFLGGFFFLPIFGLKFAMKNIKDALAAYEGNISIGGTAKWIEDEGSDTTTWSAELDLGTAGHWHVEIGAEWPVAKDKINLPAAVTVWLHPESRQPCLIKSEAGIFPARKIRRLG